MIILYILETCPYCNRALEVLNENSIKYQKIIVPNTESAKNKYKKQSGMRSFPQIFMQVKKENFIKIGGCDDLIELVNTCNNIRDLDINIDVLFNMYKSIYKK